MADAILGTRAVIKVSGEGAEKLLADTLTGRIDRTMAGEGRWFALLSPQGKVATEGLVTYSDDVFWLDIEAGTAADFVRKMKLYRLRAKADIVDVSANHWVRWSDASITAGIVYRDTRDPSLGYRSISVGPAERGGSARPYHQTRIAVGIPELGLDFGPDEVFPHDIGMDLLGGVDFKKGCYVGQEVVSRMQHRGTARRRPVIVSGPGVAARVPVMAGMRAAGDMGDVVEGAGVAILRLDRIDDPAAVTVADAPAQVSLPHWATYRFGESAAAE